MGKNRALFALGHLLLRIAYQLLLTKKPYIELGSEYLVEKEKQKEQRLINSLKARVYQVVLVS